MPVSGKGNHLLLGVLGQRKGPQGFIWAKMVPESGLAVVTSHQGAIALQFTVGAVTKEEDLVHRCSLELHPTPAQQQRERERRRDSACVTFLRGE